MTDPTTAWLNQYTANTADSYRRDLNQFSSWLGHTTGKTDLLAAERTDIQNWIKHLRTRKHLTDPTVRRKASALSSFYEYAAQEDLIDHNPARHTKRPKGETMVKLGLTETQARQLVAAARSHSPSAYALILVMITSALRISEALGIDVHHITIDAGDNVVQVTRKGGTRAYIYITPTVKDALHTAATNREAGPIFIGPKQRRLGRRRAYTLLKELGETAGIGTVTPHLLRHTAATNAIRAGATEGEVQDLLGHKSGDTTRRYLRALKRRERRPADQLTQLLTGD
jgi:site-specific recombinase XerD